MATNPIGGTPSSVIHPNRFPPAAAARVASRMLDRFNREELSNAIEVLVTMLDVWDGDPDFEEGGDDEPLSANGDSKDAAWIEWQTMRGSQKRGPNIITENEDDEEDDPAEEDDHSGQCTEDEISSGVPSFGWGGPMAAGCPISDPGMADSGALQEAHGLDAPNYGVDQTEPLGAGHHI